MLITSFSLYMKGCKKTSFRSGNKIWHTKKQVVFHYFIKPLWIAIMKLTWFSDAVSPTSLFLVAVTSVAESFHEKSSALRNPHKHEIFEAWQSSGRSGSCCILRTECWKLELGPNYCFDCSSTRAVAVTSNTSWGDICFLITKSNVYQINPNLNI